MFLIFSGAEYDTKLGGSHGSTVKKLLEELYEKVNYLHYIVSCFHVRSQFRTKRFARLTGIPRMSFLVVLTEFVLIFHEEWT